MLLTIGYKSSSGMRWMNPRPLSPPREGCFWLAWSPAAWQTTGFSRGLRGQEIKPSGLLPVIPTLSSSCNSISTTGRNINWVKWEEVGHAVLFHTLFSKFVHKCAVFTPELKHLHSSRCFTDGNHCGWVENFYPSTKFFLLQELHFFSMEIPGNNSELNNQTKGSGV